MYLFKLRSIVVQIRKCICSNCNIYFSKLENVFVQISKYMCPNLRKVAFPWIMYLFKLQNIFVLIRKYICSICLLAHPHLQDTCVWHWHCLCLWFPCSPFGISCHLQLSNIVVQVTKCICPNYKLYLSKLQNIFVQIWKCICASSLWATLCAVITSIPFHEQPLR